MDGAYVRAVGFIEGDGIGPEIWRVTKAVLDTAVSRAYKGQRRIQWRELLAGEKAFHETGQWLPPETVEAVRQLRVAIKGPLTTPVGSGIRSLNVALRRLLDLYACIRPVRHIPGVPSPLKHPERVDMVVFRENTEDVYVGIEFPSGSPEAEELRRFLSERHGMEIRPGSAIGIKPMSPEGSRRLIRKAILYALERGYPSLTLMHKGNIMKYTEGGFRQWGYDLAREEFRDRVITESELGEAPVPPGCVVLKDRMADQLFQQVLLRPEDYHVIATPNLNGDYLSDALAAQVGGLGMAPGANMGDGVALFEATHGSAPKYAGLNKVNPSSLILSGAMMLEHLGWTEAASAIEEALKRTISKGIVTYDLARQMSSATEVTCSKFGDAVMRELEEVPFST